MTGIDPRTSGIQSDRSSNWATTTAISKICLRHMLQMRTRHARYVNVGKAFFTEEFIY